MDSARADRLAARRQLDTLGWIARNAETYRHLPPPAAQAWLGEEDGAATDEAIDCEAPALAGAGWTLHPVGHSPQGRVDARWLDAGDPDQRAELLRDLPAPGDGDSAPFAWAHRSLLRQGLRLSVGGTPGADREANQTVWLQLRHLPRAVVEAPMLVIDIQPGVDCVLVESHERDPAHCSHPIVQNLHSHVRLGAGATLRHLRLATPGADDRIAHHLQVVVGAKARYEQALIGSSSRYHLQRQAIDLHADDGVARTGTVLFANGGAIELQARLSHAAQRTRSAVRALALASGAAMTVVNAHSRIAPDAGDTEVLQRLSGIPTGHGAGQRTPRIVLRPHLEILHDQVQAAHGATWGALPEDAIFYARQRGLSAQDARSLVVQGMAAALLEDGLGGSALMEALGVDAHLARAVARHLGHAEETANG